MRKCDFITSLGSDAPPADLSKPLLALWWQRKGAWKKAHEVVQSDDGAEAAWVHALLHREEGDLSNAGYWYRHAKRNICDDTLEAEWETIVSALAS